MFNYLLLKKRERFFQCFNFNRNLRPRIQMKMKAYGNMIIHQHPAILIIRQKRGSNLTGTALKKDPHEAQA